MPTVPTPLGSSTVPQSPASRWPSPVSKAAAGFLAVIFPTLCPVCGQEASSPGWISVCTSCWETLKPWQGAGCARCGLPFASVHAADSSEALCGACRNGTSDFDLARSYGVYTFPLRELILEVKFRRRERWGRTLGTLLASLWPGISSCLLDGQPLIVPVPLHAARQRERGFNQAELLAHGLRRKLGRGGVQPPQLDSSCLRRTLPTRPQTGLSHRTRFENVRGAFAVSHPKRVRGRSVVLIDDVMTTGATISACARALKQAGASQVLGLTLARATPQFPGAGRPATPVDEPPAG